MVLQCCTELVFERNTPGFRGRRRTPPPLRVPGFAPDWAWTMDCRGQWTDPPEAAASTLKIIFCETILRAFAVVFRGSEGRGSPGSVPGRRGGNLWRAVHGSFVFWLHAARNFTKDTEEASLQVHFTNFAEMLLLAEKYFFLLLGMHTKRYSFFSE